MLQQPLRGWISELSVSAAIIREYWVVPRGRMPKLLKRGTVPQDLPRGGQWPDTFKLKWRFPKSAEGAMKSIFSCSEYNLLACQ